MQQNFKHFLRNPFLPLVIFAILTVILLESFIFNQEPSPVSQSNTPPKPPESLFFAPKVSQPSSFQKSSDSPVGRLLTSEETDKIRQLLPNAPFDNTFPAFEQVPLFILHDTAGLLAKDTIYHQQRKNNGPFGDGIAAYIARDGEPIITRVNFFETRRPTALAYEKALDILPEKVRNQKVRQVYQLTPETARNEAFKQVVTGLNLNQESLIKGAKIWLNTKSEREFERIRHNYANHLDGAKSTGLWAVTQICHDILDLGSNKTKSANLVKACQSVYPSLKATRQRVMASVNVEIVQYTGSHCFTTEAQVKEYNAYAPPYSKIPGNKVIPLKKAGEPLYPDVQYDGLVLVYLYSALQAGIFPEITTHFLLDKGIGSHCDPRGFDLDYFYQKVSEALGHSPGTRYGIYPQYGMNLEVGDNIWWSKQILGSR